VFCGEARTSLIGAVPAVWFDWHIEQRPVQLPFGRTDQNDGDWQTAARGSSNEPFALDDGAGNRLLIWPTDADVRDTNEREWAGDFPDTMSGTLRDGMIEGIGLLSSLTGVADLRFTEHWLPPGVACFVIGRVEPPEPAHGPGVRGLIRSGNRTFFIAAGTPGTALESLRRTIRLVALFGAAAFVLAVALSVFA
jgi:E3 Ubiquitin ligase